MINSTTLVCPFHLRFMHNVFELEQMQNKHIIWHKIVWSIRFVSSFRWIINSICLADAMHTIRLAVNCFDAYNL